MGGISLWQLIIILLIVLLLFGTKRLRGIGGDLGNAIKSFRKAVQSEDDGPRESAEREGGADSSASAGDAARKDADAPDAPDRKP